MAVQPFIFRSEVCRDVARIAFPCCKPFRDACREGATVIEQRTNPLTYGANMKQKFLVINCNETDVEELRQRLGERQFVTCESIDEVARYLPSPSRAVVMSQQPVEVNAVTESYGQEPTDRKSELEELVQGVLEQNNGHARTLAARVDMLEQKIIEYSLNRNGQHRKETAAELGISRVTLYNKMKKFGLLD